MCCVLNHFSDRSLGPFAISQTRAMLVTARIHNWGMKKNNINDHKWTENKSSEVSKGLWKMPIPCEHIPFRHKMKKKRSIRPNEKKLVVWRSTGCFPRPPGTVGGFLGQKLKRIQIRGFLMTSELWVTFKKAQAISSSNLYFSQVFSYMISPTLSATDPSLDLGRPGHRVGVQVVCHDTGDAPRASGQLLPAKDQGTKHQRSRQKPNAKRYQHHTTFSSKRQKQRKTHKVKT